jgi:hypothetical protein
VESLERRTVLSAPILDTVTIPNGRAVIWAGEEEGTAYTQMEPAQLTRVDDTHPENGDIGVLGAPGYQIVIHFTDASLTPSQQAIFNTAADRWESIILGELSDINLNWGEGTQVVDDIHIDANAPAIDGVGGILGQAGPDFIRNSNDLTITGIMQFDSADVADLEADGEFDEVILHEMGHVLGLGTLWGPSERNLILNPGTSNPRYTGALAIAQYQAIFGVATANIPVENTGGPGTADGHWREGGGAGVAFDREIMTGFLDSGVVNPLSRISLAQFADLGYPSVNVNAFDVFNPTNGGNAYPTIASLSDSADPVPPNSSFTLTANTVADTAPGTISTVRFYRETNNITGLQVLSGTVGDIQGDTFLGQDTLAAGGYTFLASTTGLSPGTYTYYAQATDNQNLASVSVSTTNVVSNISATPGTPDLLAATDTGTSGTDNITNRNNANAARNLQFSVSGTVAGATVSIYSSGTLIGSAVSGGATTTVTTNGTTALADGLRSITARQTESGKTESADSAALGVTIDTAVPTVDVTDVSPDPRLTGVSSINVVFNEAVNALPLANLALTRTSVNVPLTASQTPTTANNITFTVPNLLSLTSINGTYQLTVSIAGITDVAGNALGAAASDTWVHNLPAWLGAGSIVSWNSDTKVLTVTGATSIIGDPFADLPTINASGAASVITINPTAALAVRVNSFNLSTGATATITSLGGARTATNHRVLVTKTLSIDATSTINLTDNDLVVDYTGGSPIATVEADVRDGYNVVGDWLGQGIRSSIAAGDGSFTVGVADNAALPGPCGPAQGGPLFGSLNVDLTSVLVKFTHRADLNLDGLVDPNDASIFGTNYSENDTSFWAIGDLDIDGLFSPNDASIFGTFYDESLLQI